MNTVKVYLENGDSFITKINGNEIDIHNYYDNAVLNMGITTDNMQRVKSIEILKEG